MEDQYQDGKEEVIQAWYMDDSEEDQRLPHHREPKEFIPLDKLSELGILSWRLNANDWENDENLKKIREARGYSYMDICDVCPEKLPNYEAKLKNFFEEHLHTDEEIRYCLEGSGYFDVRDQNDQWIRIAVKKGGMIVLPAGMYHRFTLDTDNYIKAMRLFVGEPVWTPYNRPHDHLPARRSTSGRRSSRPSTRCSAPATLPSCCSRWPPPTGARPRPPSPTRPRPGSATPSTDASPASSPSSSRWRACRCRCCRRRRRWRRRRWRRAARKRRRRGARSCRGGRWSTSRCRRRAPAATR